jgi:multidrug efflux pump subunit AcrA (membrane-fusion protein)
MRNHQQLPHPEPDGEHRDRSHGRWAMRGLIAIAMVAAVASVAALIRGAGSSREVGPSLTHTISRGDLVVTVTEHGTLESSENTEIKCKVRGQSTVVWVVESGTVVQAGDELVRLDTLRIENSVNERTKYAHWSRSSAERSRATVARAELAVPEYLQGRYLSQLMTLEKDLAIAESNLRTAQNMLGHAEMMAERGYKSELEVEKFRFAVEQADLNVEVKATEIDVLKEYTKRIELETLRGNLKAARARLAADEERAIMDAARRDLAEKELKHCVVKAEQSGLVIHPSAARWRNAPEIEQGATVHKDQVLLLMPDLTKMQVKVGIRESLIDRVKPGLAARVMLPDGILDGEVSSVASVTKPAGWWSGNVALYDTIITLPPVPGLKPGMSAEVEIIVKLHEDVLRIPVAAIVETAEGDFCWVRTDEGLKRRSLRLGDTNDVFTVVKAGLKEGDQVVLNTLALEGEQAEGPGPQGETKTDERDSAKSEGGDKPPAARVDKPNKGDKPAETKSK